MVKTKLKERIRTIRKKHARTLQASIEKGYQAGITEGTTSITTLIAPLQKIHRQLDCALQEKLYVTFDAITSQAIPEFLAEHPEALREKIKVAIVKLPRSTPCSLLISSHLNQSKCFHHLLPGMSIIEDSTIAIDEFVLRHPFGEIRYRLSQDIMRLFNRTFHSSSELR